MEGFSRQFFFHMDGALTIKKVVKLFLFDFKSVIFFFSNESTKKDAVFSVLCTIYNAIKSTKYGNTVLLLFM